MCQLTQEGKKAYNQTSCKINKGGPSFSGKDLFEQITPKKENFFHPSRSRWGLVILKFPIMIKYANHYN